MNKEKALKNQGLEFREDIIMGGVNNNRYINIYSMKMAGYLLLKGFIPEEYQKSHKDSERTRFFFLETGELLRATSEFNRLKNFNGNVFNI